LPLQFNGRTGQYLTLDGLNFLDHNKHCHFVFQTGLLRKFPKYFSNVRRIRRDWWSPCVLNGKQGRKTRLNPIRKSGINCSLKLPVWNVGRKLEVLPSKTSLVILPMSLKWLSDEERVFIRRAFASLPPSESPLVNRRLDLQRHKIELSARRLSFS